MVEAVQEALGRLGIDDQVVAAGLFFPRGHTGAMFAGGLAGGGIGEVLGVGWGGRGGGGWGVWGAAGQ
jgi:hypothetical protein